MNEALATALAQADGMIVGEAPAWVEDLVWPLADAAHERLTQLEGDALVIERVGGEWPKWAQLVLLRWLIDPVSSASDAFDALNSVSDLEKAGG